jgi:hypothetical protein
MAVKRRVLRQEPEGRFVLYRSGGAPDPYTDLILDLKLQAKPFVCSMEGMWAEECGIPVELASTISDHAAFFKSKERRQMLAKSGLPKDTAESLRFALCAVALRSTDSIVRDAARSMAARAIIEWSREDEVALRAISAAGLAQAFWSAMREHLGYAPSAGSEPSVGDMAFRMLEGMCGDIVEDDGRQILQSRRRFWEIWHVWHRQDQHSIMSSMNMEMQLLMPSPKTQGRPSFWPM